LIRSRDGQGLATPACGRAPFCAPHLHASRPQPWSEVIHFPAPMPGKARDIG
jgi:hypothetical protein